VKARFMLKTCKSFPRNNGLIVFNYFESIRTTSKVGGKMCIRDKQNQNFEGSSMFVERRKKQEKIVMFNDKAGKIVGIHEASTYLTRSKIVLTCSFGGFLGCFLIPLLARALAA
jgi:hypothetical protein